MRLDFQSFYFCHMNEQKVAIVCGSTQGIGKAIAHQLASEGVQVVLVGRNPERLQATRQALEEAFGPQPQPIQADFSQPMEVKSAIAAWVAQGNVAHILINNSLRVRPSCISVRCECIPGKIWELAAQCLLALWWKRDY